MSRWVEASMTVLRDSINRGAVKGSGAPLFLETTVVLQTLSFVLLVTWLMSLVTGYVFGGMAHILPVLAVALLAVAYWKRRHRRTA